MTSKSEYDKQYYRSNKAFCDKINRKNYYNLRDSVVRAYGGKCIKCGLDRIRLLMLPFKDKSSANAFAKKYNVKGGDNKYRKLRDLGFPKNLGIIVLCKRCYQERRKGP